MTRPVALPELVSYLDEYLRIREVPDDANAVNGLQVENGGMVSRIVATVDATLATIEGLGPRGTTTASAGPLQLVHHGLFWDGNQPVTGRRFRRLRALLDRDAALYSAHLPLDVHPEVGNNAVLARRLGLREISMFGHYKGALIGVEGGAPADAATLSAVIRKLAEAIGIPEGAIRLVPGAGEKVERIGIITGGAGSMIAQARDAGCDTFITGEGAAHTFHDAMEWGVNVLYAGHYATETVGVRALAEHLGEQFGLPWEFHDHPTGM